MHIYTIIYYSTEYSHLLLQLVCSVQLRVIQLAGHLRGEGHPHRQHSNTIFHKLHSHMYIHRYIAQHIHLWRRNIRWVHKNFYHIDTINLLLHSSYRMYPGKRVFSSCSVQSVPIENGYGCCTNMIIIIIQLLLGLVWVQFLFGLHILWSWECVNFSIFRGKHKHTCNTQPLLPLLRSSALTLYLSIYYLCPIFCSKKRNPRYLMPE